MKFRQSISYQLARINTAHKTALEKSMNEIGLHSGQVFVLLELWRNNGLRQVDLAARLTMHRAPSGEWEHPLMQPHSPDTKRVLDTLMRPGNEAIERDRNTEAKFRHG